MCTTTGSTAQVTDHHTTVDLEVADPEVDDCVLSENPNEPHPNTTA